MVAQGLENSPREDLSFIERAVFAMHIEEARHTRSVIQDALSIDRAEASKLLAVARAVPSDIVQAIGKAPKVGRGRWQALADLFKDDATAKRANIAIREDHFRDRPSDKRFLAVFAAAQRRDEIRNAASRDRDRTIVSTSGSKIGQARLGDRELKLTIDKSASSAFADFLVEQFPHCLTPFLRRRTVQVKPRPDRPHLAIIQEQTQAKKKGPRNVTVPEALLCSWQLRESHFRESQSSVS